jgi:putative hemolysin
MELIKQKDILHFSKLDKLKLTPLVNVLMKLLGYDKINQLYQNVHHKIGEEFIKGIFSRLNITYKISEKDFAKIPKQGPFIIVSNHPFGAVDGLILLDAILKIRPDLKLMANFLLSNIEQLNQYIIPVNPYENKAYGSNYKSLKSAYTQLMKGSPVAIFPAGEVSSFNSNRMRISDHEWKESVLKLIKNAKVPVVPVYFHGRNSMKYQVVGFINKYMQSASLPNELINKSNSEILVRIGKPIDLTKMEEFFDLKSLGEFLRAKTYSLGLVFNDVSKKGVIKKNNSELILPIPKQLLLNEFKSIAQYKIITVQQYEVYFIESNIGYYTLQELGRLREKTFREAGEGTNKDCDIDDYDMYYSHLILWDAEKNKIVGAYRIGRGDEIMNKYGKKGFYTHSLFKYKNEFNAILSESLELGRSFVVKEYQSKALPLALLWKGILHVMKLYPEYRYLLGPVSISSDFSKASKVLIAHYIKTNFYNSELADLVKARKSFKVKGLSKDLDVVIQDRNFDVTALEKMVEDIEPNGLKMPVLLKQYMRQNAKIIGFNLDPNFNNALDGLMILDYKANEGMKLEGISKYLLEGLTINQEATTGVAS